VAVSPDEPENVRKLAAADGLEYTILTDAGGEVIERYGIRNLRHTRGVLPDPTALVLDREGRVRYKRIDEDYRVRPPAEELVAAVRALPPAE
jgi:peroxiredoxin